jgi:hypothetical protein
MFVKKNAKKEDEDEDEEKVIANSSKWFLPRRVVK